MNARSTRVTGSVLRVVEAAQGSSCRGRVALVTGASRGIGKAIALRLAAEGASVAICARPRPGLPDLGTIETARDALVAFEMPVLALPFDVGDATLDRASFVRRIEDELGPIDILVNNAAAGGFRPFLEWTDAQIENILEVNLRAPWQLIRAVLPGMLQRGRGWVLNVSSQTAELPPGPPFPATHPATKGTMYGGSKAFMNRWTRSLAAEVHGSGVAVNTLAPQAASATEVLLKYADLADYLYEPLDVTAEAALALCTGDAATLTGQVGYSLDLLVALQRPVYDLTGRALVDGWQPSDLPSRIERMRQHTSGEITAAPSNIDRVTGGRLRPTSAN